MKKIYFRIFMTCAILIALLSGALTAFAKEAVTMEVGSTEGFPGDTVNIDVSLRNLPESNVSGAQFRMSYNSEVLELLAVDEFNGILTGGGQGTNNLKDNPYIISYGDGISVINTDVSGKIATFSFRILQDAKEGTTTELTLTCDQIADASLYADEIPVSPDTVTGVVTIKSYAHKHEFGEWVVVREATCTEDGLRSRVCPGCGTEETETIEKKGHSLSDWIEVKKASCTENGQRVKKCESCGETIETEVIEAAGHVPYTETVDEANCTEQGIKHTYCSICEAFLGEERIPATGHTPGDWVTLTEASCSEDGEKVRYCEECGEIVESQVVPATGHEEGEWSLEVEPTCTGEGQRVLHCSVCGDVINVQYLDPLGHDFGDWEVAREATAEEEGLRIRVCSVCGEEEKQVIPKIGHEECDHHFDGEEEYSLEPTCTEGGILRIYCGVEGCDAFVEENVPPKGHTAGEWTVTKEATCTEDGEQALTCEDCGFVMETKTVPAKGHDFGDWTETKEPTCTESGERQRECGECGHVEKEVVAPKAHAFGEWHVTKEATCTEPGTKERECEGCDATESEPVDALGHQEGEWTIVEEASCTKAGRREKRCERCGELLDEEEIPQKEHSVKTWEVKKSATCTEDGKKEGRCTGCGQNIEEIIPATGHSVGESPVVTIEPSCETGGERGYLCENCGEVFGKEAIPALGHDYADPVVTKEPTCTKAGEQVQKCRRCGDERHTALSETGHAYGESIIKRAATAEKEGISVRICEKCGNELKTSIPKLDPVLTKKSISGAAVTGIKAKTYTGKAQTQAPVVKVDGKQLKVGTDYKLSYKNNVNAGTATVTLTGLNNYKGTLSKSFKINPASIAKATVTGIKNRIWTGGSQTQTPVVKLGAKTLTKGTHYTVSYTNNKNVGTAKLTIKGKGNYSGTVTASFKINPKGTTLSGLTPGSGQIKIVWNKQASQTTGYQIQYSTLKDFKTKKTITVSGTKNTSKTVKSLLNKTKYYVRIRTYKMVGANKYYSSWSAVKNTTTK